jgi:hypothetical protein
VKRATAKRVVEVSATIFLETLIIICFYPELRQAPAALVASVSLVTSVVTLFDNFYGDRR